MTATAKLYPDDHAHGVGVLSVFVAGFSFIFPAFLITAAFAWAYVEFGSLPQVEPFLYDIKPAVLAIIFATVWKLGKTAVKGWQLAIIGSAVIAASILELNEVLSILLGGAIGLFWLHFSNQSSPPSIKQSTSVLAYLSVAGIVKKVNATETALAAVLGNSIAGVSLLKLGLFFLKVAAGMRLSFF